MKQKRYWTKTIRMTMLLMGIIGMFAMNPHRALASDDEECGPCEEWDPYQWKCVPLPDGTEVDGSVDSYSGCCYDGKKSAPKCWTLVKAGSTDVKDSKCVAGFCTYTIEYRTYNVAVLACKGKEGYKTWKHKSAIDAKYQAGKKSVDLDAMAGAIGDLMECIRDNPDGFTGSVLQAIVEYQTNLQMYGEPLTALCALGAAQIAALLDGICQCISCEPCDYVKCENDSGQFFYYTYTNSDYLTGGNCP